MSPENGPKSSRDFRETGPWTVTSAIQVELSGLLSYIMHTEENKKEMRGIPHFLCCEHSFLCATYKKDRVGLEFKVVKHEGKWKVKKKKQQQQKTTTNKPKQEQQICQPLQISRKHVQNGKQIYKQSVRSPSRLTQSLIFFVASPLNFTSFLCSRTCFAFFVYILPY